MASIRLEALAEAAATIIPGHAGLELARFIRTSPYLGEPDLTWTDAGLLLAIGFAGPAFPLATLTLDSVEIKSSIVSQVASLDLEELLAHPVLAAWVGVDIADAIGRLLRSGAVLGFHAVDAPYIETAAINAAGENLWAEISYRFERSEGVVLSATARYGRRPIQSAPVVSTNAVSGSTLMAIGMEALTRTKALNALPPSTSSDEMNPREITPKTASGSGALH